MEFSLLWAALPAAAAVYVVLRLDASRSGRAGTTRQLWDVALGAILAGLVAGRLAAMIIGGTNPLTHPADILIIRSGVHTGTAATAALLAVGWLARRDLLGIADAIAPAALAGLATWQAGCLVRGACLGTPTGLPWGISQSGSQITRHPVEIYAALLLAAAAAGLFLLRRLRRPPGTAAGIALAAAGAARLVTEPLRPALGGRPNAWYAAGVVAGAGIVAVAALRMKQRPAVRGEPD